MRGINGAIRASGRLQLSPDLDVFAWVCERWLAGFPERDPEGIARFTLYDLGTDLYGRKPAGKERRLLRASLLRLWRVEVAFLGHNTVTRTRGDSLDRLFYAVGSNGRLEEAGNDPRKVGALRGDTFAVRLSDWLRDSLAAGNFTYLRWAVLRRLEGLSKRVWLYLAAERFKPQGEGRLAAWVGLGRPALASLGADTYNRHRDARRALARAGLRIVEADPRFESVTVERRAGGWALVAVRLDAAELRRQEQERREVREAIRASGFDVPELPDSLAA